QAVVLADRQQRTQPLVEEGQAPRRSRAGGDEGGVQLRREEGVKRPAAVRRDADPVALEAVPARAIPLVDGDVDAGPDEPVGKGEPAGAGADDHDAMKWGGHGMQLLSGVRPPCLERPRPSYPVMT